MNKRIISTLLSVSIFCSCLTAFAVESEPNLDFNTTINQSNISVNYDTLPKINIDEQNSVVLTDNTTTYSELNLEQQPATTAVPKYFFEQNNIIKLPEIETEPGENQNTSSLTTRSLTTPTDSSYRLEKINSKDSFALQNQTGRTNFIGDNIGEEYIDPMTGNLIVTETDLSLPGIDGLDLNLSRYYSLAQAELYTKTAKIENIPKTLELSENMYVVNETVYNTETEETSTYKYPYSSQEAAELRMEEINSRDTGGQYMYSASCDISNEGDLLTLDYYYISEITSTSYQRMRNNLGAGWSWSFPSVQTIKDNYTDEDEIPKALYYHDGKGNVMEVGLDELNRYTFVNYEGKDIIFDVLCYFDNDICTSSRIDYMVEDSDGIKYYFGVYGELRTVMDRYGNKITFDYNFQNFYGAENVPILTRITDTVGRVVNFKYTVEGDYEYITLTITSPLESERELTLTYKKKMCDITTNTDEFISSEPILETVTNANGEETTYYPAIIDGNRNYAQSIKFTFADKTFDSILATQTGGYENTLVYLLGNIVRPHSNTYYKYDLCERNLGNSGISQAYRISERGDDALVLYDDGNTDESNIVDGYSNNVVSYRYSLDYTGYPNYYSIESIPEGNYIARTKEIKENATFTREFYKRENAVLKQEEQVIYTNPVGNNLEVTHTVSEFFYKQPSIIKSTYSNGDGHTYDSYTYREISDIDDKTWGKPLLITEELDYETVLSSEREKHAVAYTYDSDTGFVLEKSWYQASDKKCIENYTYDGNDRLSKVRMADGSTVEYDYEYSDGKVSKKTATTKNDTGTTVVEENYTSETAYAYPSMVVETVTENNNKTTQTTSYTYDMLLGIVETVTDNDGNTTYYEYDNIGRPTRIVYPKYSTYSEYGSKDIEILPVEDISYNTLSRDYENVILSDEKLVTQKILNTLTYYDVTNKNIVNPTNNDLKECAMFYYGAQINYYLGTGEIIESNVLDKVEGIDTIVTTTYYYNTNENTITVVDSKGNTKVTQYDGLGREVKITDEFDNYHIVEYNISSDEIGFKSQSYFVPANDRSAKENITEYKYDRLQRLVSEKGYSDYPNAFSEIKYTYDFAGNVIGVIDSNGNLNEDGYTQTNTYDRLNRITSSKNAVNETLKNTYDNTGNIKKQTITDSDGNESMLYQRSYDGEGKIISDTDNAGNSNTYYYNNMGQLVQTVDKDSKQHNSAYNELGMQDTETHVKPQELLTARNYSITNPYGAATVFDLRGVYVEDSGNYGVYDTQTAQYSYSQTGKLLSQMNTYAYDTGIDDVSFIPYIHYKYDSVGNITSALHGTVDDANQKKWGTTTFYEYDKNRLSKVQIDGSNTKNTADSVNVQYEYYADGKLKSVTFPALTDGTVLKSEYTYDGLSRLQTLTNYKGTDILSSYSYTYDSNGNILTTNETVEETQNNVTYTYDKLNRIATVSGTKGADSYYEYDSRGNRKANYEEIDFISEENAEFRYDEEDRLYYAKVGNDTTSFEYSSNGYRYVKQENSNYPEFYIYDESGRLTSEATLVILSINGEERIIMYPFKQYIWGSDRVLAQLDVLAGNSYYYLYNGHGDVVQITDTAGNIVNSYDYDVWGNFLKKDETIDNPFTYFGQTYDETTGLYYLRARYYDPTTGRFTQQDTAEDGYNWYVYGNQNPVMFADFTGTVSTSVAEQRIKDNSLHIVAAGKEFDINPAILGAIIYAEQVLNVNYTEGAEDYTQAILGLDCSVGLSQVRISTAKKIEDNGYIEKTYQTEITEYSFTNPFTGKAVYNTTVISRESQIYDKLSNNNNNIRYAAAYLALIEDLWKDSYPEIGGRTAVLGTLYNIGENGKNGPNSTPQTNSFGNFAKENYYNVREWLGLD